MKSNSFTRIFSAAAFAAMLSLSSSVFAQVKVGSNPASIGATSNLEVEATNGNKTSVNKATGQLTIQDGTQGDRKVLTSDANGASSWQSLNSQRVAETIFIGEQSSADYLITQFNGTFNAEKDRIPLVARTGSLTGYDPNTKQYTIQESGYYRFHTGAYMIGTLPSSAGTTIARLYLVPGDVLEEFTPINNTNGPVLSTFWEGYYVAGTKVNPYVVSTGQLNQNIIVRRTFLSVTKLF